MADRADDIQPQYDTLVTGHFTQGPDYSTRRTRGTKDYLLIYTDSGHGRFGAAEGEIVTSAGDFVLLPPGTPHDYGAKGEAWELTWAHFLPHPSWHELLQWPRPSSFRLRIADPLLQRNAQQSLRDAHAFATGAGKFRELFALNALEKCLLWCASALPSRSKLDTRVQTAMQFLAANLSRPVTIEDAAQAAGLSPSRLTHLFSAQTGQTPGTFLEARRLERARQLLTRTGLTVQSIASDVGYDNPFYFSLRFKKQTGQSPSAFRHAAQREENSRG